MTASQHLHKVEQLLPSLADGLLVLRKLVLGVTLSAVFHGTFSVCIVSPYLHLSEVCI